ncbi:6776_t:CDS:2, partial [Diversispora eburnea]
IQPQSKLHIFHEPCVLTESDFVVTKGTMSMNKTLQNVDPRNEYGEMKIATKILACAEISAEYWEEVFNSFPKRWPRENYNKSGLDLADPSEKPYIRVKTWNQYDRVNALKAVRDTNMETASDDLNNQYYYRKIANEKRFPLLS